MSTDFNTNAYRSLHNALMVYKEDLVNLTDERLGEFIQHHYNYQRPRMIKLDSYYKGINTKINSKQSRRVDEYGADVRLGHPFAQEIADFHTAFSVGNPVNVSVNQQDNKKADTSLLDTINAFNDKDSLFYDLFSDMSKFGRSFANVYRDQDAKLERITRLSPIDTFIIYSKDIDPVPIMAVRYTPITTLQEGEEINEQAYIVETWTDNEYRQSKPSQATTGEIVGWNADSVQNIVSLPVIEFWNNSQRMGDYDGVIGLIDAYDSAQSDTANYMQDSNDAMLVIQGDLQDLLEEANFAADPEDESYLNKLADEKRALLRDIRKSRTLFLKSGISATGQQTSVQANYIHKQYDSAGVEAYKNRLYKNIHSFSRTPDVSDDNFASNSSGVAMQYKQLGVIQLAKTKRRSFEKGLTAIYKVVQELEKAVSGAWKINYLDINFMFTDNLPTDDVATIQAIQQAGAQLPKEYLDRYAPSITTDELDGMRERENEPMDDMQAEMQRLQDKNNSLDDADDNGDVEDVE